MIVCPRCGKENQDHYKFCLGCGAELPRDAEQAPKSFTAPTPPSGVPSVSAPVPLATAPSDSSRGHSSSVVPAVSAPSATRPAKKTSSSGSVGAEKRPVVGSAVHPRKPSSDSVAQPSPAATVPSAAIAGPTSTEKVNCPRCGAINPQSFKFCGSCGFDLTKLDRDPSTSPREPQSEPTVEAPRGSLVVIRPDGTEGAVVPLSSTTKIGRDTGGPFAGDFYLSPLHATFRFSGSDLMVTDENSLNGIYVRIEREIPVELAAGSIFRIGQEIIRFDPIASRVAPEGVEIMGSPNPGYLGRISLVVGRDTFGNSFCIPSEGMHLGRERGDIVRLLLGDDARDTQRIVATGDFDAIFFSVAVAEGLVPVRNLIRQVRQVLPKPTPIVVGGAIGISGL
ncbi:MAG: zinc-ribbon domain-containing protein, partial [Myxococcota bacterium]